MLRVATFPTVQEVVKQNDAVLDVLDGFYSI
jgi:hypothetical protein